MILPGTIFRASRSFFTLTEQARIILPARPPIGGGLVTTGSRPVEFNPSSAYLPGDVADGTGCPSGRAGGTKYPFVSVFRN